MIISASTDYRAAAESRLPPFLFHYIDGGAYAEHTLKRNTADLADIALRQRVLRDMSSLSLETELFGEKLAMPVALAPVGLTGCTHGAVKCRRRKRQPIKAFRLPCPRYPCVRLRKLLRRLSARCGSSSMYCAIAVL